MSALIMLGGDGAESKLGELALRDNDIWVRRYSLLALRSTGTPKARSAIEQVIEFSTDISRRAEAYRALNLLDNSRPRAADDQSIDDLKTQDTTEDKRVKRIKLPKNGEETFSAKERFYHWLFYKSLEGMLKS